MSCGPSPNLITQPSRLFGPHGCPAEKTACPLGATTIEAGHDGHMNAGEFVVMFLWLMLVVTGTVVVQKRRGTYHASA
jgi:hypothetical protein